MRCENGATTAFWPTSYLPLMTSVGMPILCMRSSTAHFLNSTSSHSHLDQTMLAVHRHVIVEDNIQSLLTVRVHKYLVQKKLDRVTWGLSAFRETHASQQHPGDRAQRWRPSRAVEARMSAIHRKAQGKTCSRRKYPGGGFRSEDSEWELDSCKVEAQQHQGLPEAQTLFRLSACARSKEPR
jgi:hypothetical protein